MSARPIPSATATEILLLELRAEVHGLRDEVRGLRADLAGRKAQQEQAAGALVRCIAEQPGGLPFTGAELLERAQVVPELRAAILKSVGSLNGKKLGKLFYKIEGVSFDGDSIVRTGRETSEGIEWVCESKPVAAL